MLDWLYEKRYEITGVVVAAIVDIAIVLLLHFLPAPSGVETILSEIKDGVAVLFSLGMVVFVVFGGFLGHCFKPSLPAERSKRKEDHLGERDSLIAQNNFDSQLGIKIKDGIVYSSIEKIPLTEQESYLARLRDLYQQEILPIYGKDYSSVLKDDMESKAMVANYNLFVLMYNLKQRQEANDKCGANEHVPFNELELTHDFYLNLYKDNLKAKHQKTMSSFTVPPEAAGILSITTTLQ